MKPLTISVSYRGCLAAKVDIKDMFTKWKTITNASPELQQHIRQQWEDGMVDIHVPLPKFFQKQYSKKED
ncbi:MAG: hypothetical protein WC449_05285 [Candidatus Paceibacterota bacterium]